MTTSSKRRRLSDHLTMTTHDVTDNSNAHRPQHLPLIVIAAKHKHRPRWRWQDAPTLAPQKLLLVLFLLLFHQQQQQQSPPANIAGEAGGYLLNLNRLLPLGAVEAVTVQRLSVPDLVVIDQLQTTTTTHAQQQPEAASLINQNQQQQQQPQDSYQSHLANGSSSSELTSSSSNHQLQPSHILQQPPTTITFECLISYDKRKDKNLVVKWHHDDRAEPIYQWIPELNKRSIAPQYRAYILPITTTTTATTSAQQQQQPIDNHKLGNYSTHPTNLPPAANQLLEAGFKLVRPSKELGGKYTCSAISVQNDDSKWKKMIVYAPPRSFRFNATRTDVGAQLADQRERLILLTQPAANIHSMSMSQQQSLPLAYRMRALNAMNNNNNYQQNNNNDNNNNNSLMPPPLISLPASPFATTISPQMYSTIDYVNVNQQQRTRLASPAQIPASSMSSAAWQTSSSNHHLMTQQQQQPPPPTTTTSQQQQASSRQNKHNGVKLVCDIDQVFPVPEVSIYRLANLDGSHPDKLAKLNTRIERYPQSGLYHVQVISVLEDDELQMKYGPLNESEKTTVYFECSIALTNLELSKYADNKRSLIYRPGLLTNSEQELNNQLESQTLSGSQSSGADTSTATIKLFQFSLSGSKPPPPMLIVFTSAISGFLFSLVLMGSINR